MRRSSLPLYRTSAPGGLLVLCVAVAVISPNTARADCAQVGSDVTCTGPDADGFDAGADDDLTVVVEDLATVANPAGDVIRLNDGSSVTVQAGGSIDATANGAAAILAGSGLVDATVRIEEGANLTASGTNGFGISLGDDWLDSGGTGAVNAGTITLTGNGTTGIAVGARSHALNDATGILQLDGLSAVGLSGGADTTLENQGQILSAMDAAVGLLTTGNGTLQNRSLIQLTGANSIGVSLDGTDSNLFNGRNGTIDAAIAVLGGTGSQTVENRGAILGDIDLGDGDDRLVLNGERIELGGTRSPFTGSVLGGGQALADTVLLGNTATAHFDLGSVSGFEALELESRAVWFLENTGNFETTTVRSGSSGLFGTPTVIVVDGEAGPTTLNGDLIFENNTALATIIDPNGVSGHLIVNGDVTVNGIVEVQLFNATPIVNEETFEILSANDILGSFELPELGGSTFLDFNVIQNGGDVDLVVSRLRTYSEVAVSGNQKKLAAHLDAALIAGPTGDLTTLFTELDQLSAAESRDAFDTLHPEAYDAHSSALLSTGFSIANLVGRDRVRCDREYGFELFGQDRTQPNPCGQRGRVVWADGFVDITSRDTTAGHIDYDTTGGAVLFGADWIGKHGLASFFFGSTRTELDVDRVGRGDATTFEVGAQANRHFGRLRLQTIALYGHGWHEQDREIFIIGPRGTARGEFESNRFLSHSEAAYTVELGRFEIAPLAQLEYAYLSEEGFTEKSAGGASLAVDDRMTSYLRSGFGARIAYEDLKYYWVHRFLAWTDGTYRAEVTGRWLRTWTGDQRTVQSRLAAAPSGVESFRTTGQDVEQAVDLGTRLSFQPLLYEAMIGIGYNFQFGDGTTSHRGTLDLRIPF